MVRSLLCLLSVLLLACGGGPSATARRETARAPEPAPRAPERAARTTAPAMEATGLTGSLSTSAVYGTVGPHLDTFAQCFATHGRELRALGGRIELKFHIATDGRVQEVYAIDSTVGHRDVERCVVNVAAALRFPRPQGGVAEATWPLELDPPEHVRHPVTWDPGRVRAVVRRRGTRLRQRCHVDGDVQVTTYVSRRGRVIAAGAIAYAPTPAERLDCVARAVRGWRMPGGGRSEAKVTFDLR